METIPYKGARVRGKRLGAGAGLLRPSAMEELAGELAASNFAGDTAILKEHAEAIRKATNIASTPSTIMLSIAPSLSAAKIGSCLALGTASLRGAYQHVMYRPSTVLRRAVAVEQHFEIVDALSRGNSPEAGHLLRRHSESAAEHLERHGYQRATGESPPNSERIAGNSELNRGAPHAIGSN